MINHVCKHLFIQKHTEGSKATSPLASSVIAQYNFVGYYVLTKYLF